MYKFKIQQHLKQTILLLVTIWQKTSFIRNSFNISQCRFYPSCSNYAYRSITQYGTMKGLILSVKRFMRCIPLYDGGIDEVPEHLHLEHLANNEIPMTYM